MKEELIVALFATETSADDAIRDLQDAGIPDAAISRHARIETVPGYTVPGTDEGPAPRSRFWARLFGQPAQADESAGHPDAGRAIIAVSASDIHAPGIIDILERHELVDLDQRATGGQLPAGALAGLPPDRVGADTTSGSD